MTLKISVTQYDLTRRPYDDLPGGGRRYDWGEVDLTDGKEAAGCEIQIPEGWRLDQTLIRDGRRYADVWPAPPAELTYGDVAAFLDACLGPDRHGSEWPLGGNWTQRANARDGDGGGVTVLDDRAVQWCSLGRMAVVEDALIPYAHRRRLRAAAFRLILAAAGSGANTLLGWQDDPVTTPEDVAAAFDGAARLAEDRSAEPLPASDLAVRLDAAAIAALPDRGREGHRYYVLCRLGKDGAVPDEIPALHLPPGWRIRRLFHEDGYMLAEIRPHSQLNPRLHQQEAKGRAAAVA